MKTVSQNRTEFSIEVQMYNDMMPTFQKDANRKEGLKEHSYKNNSRIQREGSKLKSLLNVRSQTARRRSLSRSPSLMLSERNNCKTLVRSK